jgi:hypothetical protein
MRRTDDRPAWPGCQVADYRRFDIDLAFHGNAVLIGSLFIIACAPVLFVVYGRFANRPYGWHPQRHPAINLVLHQMSQHTNPIIFFNRIIALRFIQSGWQVL